MTFDISLKPSPSPAEAAETIEMTETAANEEQHQQIPRENRGNSKVIFFCIMDRKVKEANKCGEQS